MAANPLIVTKIVTKSIGLFVRGICSYSINIKRIGKELNPVERPQESLKKIKMAAKPLIISKIVPKSIGLFIRCICSYSINIKRFGKELNPVDRPQEIV